LQAEPKEKFFFALRALEVILSDENLIQRSGHNWQVPPGKLNQQIKRGEVFGETLVANTGYCNLVFSPAASENKQAENKLGIVLTFQEWKAIGELIKQEQLIPWSAWVNARFVDFLQEAIDSIPDPETNKAVSLD
jgi:hypothetical protein